MGSSLLNNFMLGFIRFYQISLSPLMPARCRFYPSCSQYAHDAFVKYPFTKALGKTLWRLLRCHPFSSGGVDQA